MQALTLPIRSYIHASRLPLSPSPPLHVLARIYLIYFLPFCVNNPRVHHPGRYTASGIDELWNRISARRDSTAAISDQRSPAQMDEGDPFSWGNYVAVRTSAISRYGSLRAQSYRKITRFFILREAAMYRVMRSSARE